MLQKYFYINCRSIVYGERHLVMPKGASEIFHFALGLLLFDFFCLALAFQSYRQQRWHTALNCCCEQMQAIPRVITEGRKRVVVTLSDLARKKQC